MPIFLDLLRKLLLVWLERVGDFLFARSVKSYNSEKELKTTKSLTFISIISPYAFC